MISWRQSTPLRLEELSQIKLIGLSKQVAGGLPKVLERFISLLGNVKRTHSLPLDICGSPMSHTLSDYVCLAMWGLDYESETLIAPSYTGGFLDRLFTKPHRNEPLGKIPSENVLLAEVHSEYLSLANNAFLFYHLVCMEHRGGAHSGTDGRDGADGENSELDNNTHDTDSSGSGTNQSHHCNPLPHSPLFLSLSLSRYRS